MDQHHLTYVGALLGVILSTFAILAAAWAVLKPWLKAQLIDPIHETRHQVTVNGHSSDTPTVLDLLAELRDGQEQIRRDVDEYRTELQTHVTWCVENDRITTERIGEIERRQGTTRGTRR